MKNRIKHDRPVGPIVDYPKISVKRTRCPHCWKRFSSRGLKLHKCKMEGELA